MLSVVKRRFIPILCCLLLVPAAFAQMTTDDQLNAVAPATSGETGLFTALTGNMLHRGDWSFSLYLNNYDLLAAPAPEMAPLSSRGYKDMGYDDTRLSASIGLGLTDRWEIAASIPYVQLENKGNDRAGFINGYPYVGRFTDSGMGDLHIGTKIGLTPVDAANHLALSLFTNLPTGSDKTGISSGNVDYGAGLHYTARILTVGGSYVVRASRDADKTPLGEKFNLPDEGHLDLGLNVPIRFWSATNWISEANAVFYTGGDRKPQNPIFLVTGFRHWFGTSGWALNAAARWNAAKFGKDHKECRVTELDDCALGGLVGLTYAPLHLAPVAPPPPPPPAPLPPPPAPVPPAPEPVAPPHQPQELRTDEIHFESGSARLTNIAKAILDDVALRMKQEPAATAIVIGYTDDKEATGPNADLDRRRAEAVRDYLVSRHGIDPSRITIEARGTQEPVGDNTTAEGRLKNRRVVIRLIIP